MAPMMILQSSVSSVNHFYDHYDTSNNHTICALNELDVDGGCTTSQAISNGAMCLTVAISAVCLVFSTCLIHSVHAIGLRYVYLKLYFFGFGAIFISIAGLDLTVKLL